MPMPTCILPELYRALVDKPTHMSNMPKENKEAGPETCVASGTEHAQQVVNGV